MNIHQGIFDRVREHETMTEKFHQVEVKLLAALDFRQFFETVLAEIQQAFQIPHLWFTLIKGTTVYDLACQAEGLRGLRKKVVPVDAQTLMQLIPGDSGPLLINQTLERFTPLYPPESSFRTGSMAVVPIDVDGVRVGCLHQADSDPARYRPGLSTVFLRRLATKLSLGLSNVAAHEQLKFLAYHDPLTQLLNRRVMETILERELNRAQRYGGTLSVAFIDLDGFKSVNDRYGHDVGDKLLHYVASGLQQMVRLSDVVTRYAGDEFVILLPETTAENARRLMTRIQQAFVDQPLVLGDLELPIRLSAGVSSTEEGPQDTAPDLLRRADQALYRIKHERTSSPTG